jgi:hypothetical protein
MFSSCAMVLMNKVVLSGFGFTSTNCLLLYQTVWCAPAAVHRATDTLNAPSANPLRPHPDIMTESRGGRLRLVFPLLKLARTQAVVTDSR